MKIVLTGGGSGGHFYPLIAVAEALRRIAREERLLEPELVYMAPEEYDKDALFENDISFKKISAGKRRTYRSLKNFFDLFKTGWGLMKAVLAVFAVFPDVVFSKGGYASVPVLLAARFFRIPVVIHESDTVPGRANLWAAKFARRIAISYPEAAAIFEKISPGAKIALTGVPVRRDLATLAPEGAREFLGLEEGMPVILVLGGSQGSQALNDALINALPELLPTYCVIHQTGKNNFDITRGAAGLVIENNPYKERYKAFPFLSVLAMRMAAGAADLIISRAGSTSIFEMALWGKPGVLIPIPEGVSRDQRTNAFAYARAGGCIVIEQENLAPHLITSEIDRLMANPQEREKMSQAAKAFAQPQAAEKIAREILELALEHEK